MDADIGDSTVDTTEQTAAGAPQDDSSTQQAVTEQAPAQPQEGSEQAPPVTDQPTEQQQQQQQGQPSAVDDAAAPNEAPAPDSSEQVVQQQQPEQEQADSSTPAIPVVKEDAVELGTDSSGQAADSRSRAAQLAQTSGAFSPADSSSAGGIPVRASTDAFVQEQQEQAGTGGWSGAQTAGLAVGIIVAAGVAGVAAMHYRRSRAPRSRLAAYSNEVEMRGLI
jgi:hypothetical protein